MYFKVLGVPPPPPAAFGFGGATQSLAREGCGGPNSDEGTDTVVLYVYMNFVMQSILVNLFTFQYFLFSLFSLA